METIHVTLPDGSVKDVPKGTTPLEIANGISPRLGSAALVAKVFTKDGPFAGEPDFVIESGVKEEGELIDLRHPLDRDVKLQILTEKDPDALYVNICSFTSRSSEIGRAH